jgi:predicted short-subunit dehydrogenase-like oxidoreductase (DUF2520 family)
MKIVLIGAGNVSTHLGPLLKSKGHTILQVFSRSNKSANTLAKKLVCDFTTNSKLINPDGDIYIVALRDEAIPIFLQSFAFEKKLIVHTSGSTDINVFPKRIENCGVLYPLQTFSMSHKSLPATIPFCIEGNNEKSLRKIKFVARSISKSVHVVDSYTREYIHLSAVMVNNFSNYMFAIAAKILKEKNISFEILRPLIMETALKVQTDEPSKMQTGPARRGDTIIIEKHLKLLKAYPELNKIYRLLSENIEKNFGPRL